MTENRDSEIRERLLWNVKKEVKCIMEEAVTRKFVHEESSSVTSLCGAVEACLLFGLKKRVLGLFKNTTSTALLQKVAKNFEPAADIAKIVTAQEIKMDESKKSVDNNKNHSKRPTLAYSSKYLWIRVALCQKVLDVILDHLVENANKYYEPHSLVADPCDGQVLASLLVGPCALDFTKMKTGDHYWTDPPADELVQRHRIHSSGNHHIRGPDSPKRPGLQVRRHTSSSSEEGMRMTPQSAKDYVESLHQNNRSTLLYGKNNVLVQPKEGIQALAGYLSLHQGNEGLTVKWTPNQLMNGCSKTEHTEEQDRRFCLSPNEMAPRSHRYLKKKGVLYWDYAVTVYMDEIVYLHCHQQPDTGGTIVLVGQDGVQRPPIHFPKGGHLLAFLSCLETGLLPHGQLDPPLWAQRGKGKVFPKLRRKVPAGRMKQDSLNTQAGSVESVNSMNGSIEEEEATDYVFRIITRFTPDLMPPEMLYPKAKSGLNFPDISIPWPFKTGFGKPSLNEIPMATVQSHTPVSPDSTTTIAKAVSNKTSIRQLCDEMKRQIISRAFYGWLAHCRHLKTVRTHLSGLVQQTITSSTIPQDASEGLTEDLWQQFNKDGVVTDADEIYRLVYHGGCSHGIRSQVWPYLLGHYEFGSTQEARDSLDHELHTEYEVTMSEWMAVEAIVRQRDKEIMAANLAKLSSESTSDSSGKALPSPFMRKDSSLSNDVFMDSVDVDDHIVHHPCDTLIEETSSVTTTPSEQAPSERSIRTLPLEKTDSFDNQIITTNLTTKTLIKAVESPDEGLGDSKPCSKRDSCSLSSKHDTIESQHSLEVDQGMPLPEQEEFYTENDKEVQDMLMVKNIIITNPSVDSSDTEQLIGTETSANFLEHMEDALSVGDAGSHISASHDSIISPHTPGSPASHASNGGVYSAEFLEDVGLNLHRIDKDVQRCDRNYFYFTPENLDKLRNIMCTYVWKHLDIGYVQGMCDLVAPLLVLLDDESKTYSCFCEFMKRMSHNFPHGGAMDTHFANMRSLIQILDSELFEHMHQNGDYTHFYFCYRWFLLDFKRELIYDDVFSVWETIWSAKHVASANFVLFVALALVEYYRDIILDNNMDFTDIIKFFNEMAEKHNAKQVLKISRDLVYKLQKLIDNK
ncbi:unnamed protein product [Owenia fusiformis]|uniref:Small G protein signaling modulator 1 n=1 Tax=Owenia fusiformis TaxID=6347 RepID=A0A8S4Q5Q2_OWEFU|nr:unnamed protein product [Owenia fusiformis]